MKGILKMKRVRNSLAFELKYVLESKLLVGLVGLIVLINIIFIVIEYQYIDSAFSNYLRMENYYEENNMDIHADLESDEYKILENQDNSVTVENPILYYHDEVCRALYVISPEYSISHIFELSILLFPLLFGVIGAFMATVDLKNKIYKHKILRFGRNNYYVSKITVIIGIVVLCTVFAAFLNKIFSIAFYNIICNKFPVEKFDVGNLEQSTNIITKLCVIGLISFCYASLGFLLGVLSKSITISLCTISVYLYIVPIFSKFEIKNSCYNLMKNVFDFYGITNISSYKSISVFISLFIVFGIIIITNVISYIIIKKRSAYI